MIVRYRNRKFNNIEAADQWLTEYLLKRRIPITGCLLHIGTDGPIYILLHDETII